MLKTNTMRSAALAFVACSCAATTTLVVAQQLREPSQGSVYTSFSGSGDVPMEYTASSGTSSINVAVSVADPNGNGNQTFQLANGLLGSGNTYQAVFAPSAGWCGAVSE